MALTYDERIAKEMKKIAELKRKQKAEMERMMLELGRRIMKELPTQNLQNVDELLAQYMAKGLSDSDRSSLMLGRMLKKRLSQYFASDDYESYKNNIDKIAEIIEKYDQI